MSDLDKYLEKMVMRFFHAMKPNCHGEPSVEMRKAIAIFRKVEEHGYERGKADERVDWENACQKISELNRSRA